ncbi:hypothetical protein HMN09_00787400 [Mycena chlorophos]|uniref:Transcription factor domain-containing protein n=1 Tax=Mycena chlorophos TaxID=658473 RepID=A0A8H6SUJ3_MYCCL|nr:hypothetical protein HMN09_00787400 [Mycena chlorophos]
MTTEGSSTGTKRPKTYLRKACTNCRARRVRRDATGNAPYNYTPPGGHGHGTNVTPPLSIDDDNQAGPSIELLSPYPSPHDFSSTHPQNSINEDLRYAYAAGSTPSPPSDLFAMAIDDPSGSTQATLDVFLDRFSADPFLFVAPSDAAISSLSTAIVLWATHLQQPTGDSTYYTQDHLVGQAIVAAARDASLLESDALATGSAGDNQHQHHPDQSQHMRIALQLIQAHVLLSLYFLEGGAVSIMQGRAHCALATSLAFTPGVALHLLGPGPPHASGPLPPRFLPQSELARARVQNATVTASGSGSIERSMPVRAFWAVVLLNNAWVAVSGAPSHIPSDTIMNTPWPAGSDSDFSLGLLAKASMLLERSIAATVARTIGGLGPGRAEMFIQLDTALDSFIAQLSYLPMPSQHARQNQNFALHVIANAAVLQLHAPYIASTRIAADKCRLAGERMLARLDNLDAESSRVDLLVLCAPLLAAFVDYYLAHWHRPGDHHAISVPAQRVLFALEILSRKTNGRSGIVEKSLGQARRARETHQSSHPQSHPHPQPQPPLQPGFKDSSRHGSGMVGPEFII